MYYFIEAQTLTDGTTAQAIYVKNTFAEAVAAFHSALAYAAQVATVKRCLCVVMNDKGLIYKNEVWERDPEAADE